MRDCERTVQVGRMAQKGTYINAISSARSNKPCSRPKPLMTHRDAPESPDYHSTAVSDRYPMIVTSDCAQPWGIIARLIINGLSNCIKLSREFLGTLANYSACSRSAL